MDFPDYRLPPPPIMTPYNPDAIGLAAAGNQLALLGGTASSGWVANNRAFFYPFVLSGFATVYQFLFFVGGTSSGNIDLGIYDTQFNRIISTGSTGMSATINTVQELNVTDTVLAPGNYYLAASCSTTSGTVFAASQADEISQPAMPLYEQSLGSVTLPDPAAPTVSTDGTPRLMAIGAQLRSVF